jgi:purine-binding chemotaxis protein CheW
MLNPDRPIQSAQHTFQASLADQQYLGFPLGEERFAIEILRVQEIRALTAITPIPNAPPHIRGVINLRGTIIPVIDLRLRFGLCTNADPRFAIILVVSAHGRIVGIIADSVPKVITLTPNEVAPAPDFGQRFDISFVSGVLHRNDDLVLLLDLERLLGEELDCAPTAQDMSVSAE